MTELLHALAMEEDDKEIDLENLTTPKTVLGVCLGYLDHNESDDLVRLTPPPSESSLNMNVLRLWNHTNSVLPKSVSNILHSRPSHSNPVQH